MKTQLFTPEDIEFLKKRGNSPEEVEHQFHFFTTGFPFANLQRAATVGDGIVRLDDTARETLIQQYDNLTAGKKLLKFVPASGAASRMFKEAFSFLEEPAEQIPDKAKELIHSLPNYALYDDLKKAMLQDHLSLDTEIENDNYKLILSYLLTDKGLNYGAKPKAVLQFHRYEDGCRTALEEHLVEAANYSKEADGTCRIHFTVSPQHLPLFKQLLENVQEKYEKKLNVKYRVEFSTQAPSTDTLAATEDNRPFRDHQGQLLFRPGGHGALIRNINDLEADVIFVKNIDNVFSEENLGDTITYKKMLAAQLLSLQEKLFAALDTLKAGSCSAEKLSEIRKFAEEELMISLNEDGITEEMLIQKLDRPLRVCGMVKNEGEPGGGPYWVKDSRGVTSLQIVESSQINQQNAEQKSIMQNSTHFNPVDMVCSFRRHNGGKFFLPDYVDDETGFISSKSYEGRPLKAMELPGLWNGAMARWITVFMEVPLTTFHPVKTIRDLQR